MPATQTTQTKVNDLCHRGNNAVAKNDLEGAKKLFEEALALGKDSMPRQMYVGVGQTLAECCVRLKNFQEAADCNRKLLRRLEEQWNEEYGPQHTLTVSIRRDLAHNLSDLSDQSDTSSGVLQEAVDLQMKNIEILKSKKKSRTLTEAQHRLAFDVAKLARTSPAGQKAGTFYQQAASLYEAVLLAWEGSGESRSSPRLINAKHNYAVVLYHLEKYEKAKQVLLENQATLDSLPETSKKGLKVLELNADRYLASCVEKTDDPSPDKSTPPNSSLDEVQSIDNTTPRKTTRRTTRPTTRPASSSDMPQTVDDTQQAVTAPRQPSPRPHASGGSLSDPQAIDDSQQAGTTPRKTSRQTSRGSPALSGSLGEPRTIGNDQQAITPSLRVDGPEMLVKPPDRFRRTTRRAQGASIMPGAFPDVKSEVGDANTDTSVSPLDNTKRKGGKAGQEAPESPANENSDTGPRPDGERLSRSREKSNEPPEGPKLHSSNNASSPGHLTPTDGDQPKRSLSNPNKKSSLEPEVTRKPRSHSSVGIEKANDDNSGMADDTSTVVVDGELFAVPTSANDADIWMMRIRRHAHRLLQYDAPLTNRKRVRVAILDSGVQRGADRSTARSDIWRRRARLQRYKDFTGENAEWTDSSKDHHGSNCASLLLQVAPEADVYIANVIRPGQDGIDPSHVAEALKWAIDEKQVDIISMSLGWEDWKQIVDKQINRAREKEVLVFAAASNDGLLKPKWGVYPAWAPTVFCINASSGSGVKWDRNPRFSKDKVNLMFLGQDVAILGNNNKPEFSNDRLTGTSFATPIAAGIAALVLDLARLGAGDFPKVEQCLKTYEGMSAVFKSMSGEPTKDDYYHVMPWDMLGKEKPQFSRDRVTYSLEEIAKCLKQFGNFNEALD